MPRRSSERAQSIMTRRGPIQHCRAPGGAGRPARRGRRRARSDLEPRRRERPAAAHDHREPRDRCPADPAFRARSPGGQAFRPARVSRRAGAQLVVGELRRLVGPGDGGRRQEPAGDLRHRQLDDGEYHLRRQPADGPHARPARAPARQPRPAARGQARARRGSRHPARRQSAAWHAAHRLRAPASYRALPRPRRPSPGAHRLSQDARRRQEHARKIRASRHSQCSRAARTRARWWHSPSG